MERKGSALRGVQHHGRHYVYTRGGFCGCRHHVYGMLLSTREENQDSVVFKVEFVLRKTT